MRRDDMDTKPTAEQPALVPHVDIVETDDGITLHADMPGVWKEGLSINVEGDTLTVEGQVSLGEPAELKGVYAEVRVARFRRAFVLSRDLDSQRIEAAVKDGVLTLRVPKLERAKPKRIEVRVG